MSFSRIRQKSMITILHFWFYPFIKTSAKKHKTLLIRQFFAKEGSDCVHIAYLLISSACVVDLLTATWTIVVKQTLNFPLRLKPYYSAYFLIQRG
jgi:hypothetical protein